METMMKCKFCDERRDDIKFQFFVLSEVYAVCSICTTSWNKLFKGPFAPTEEEEEITREKLLKQLIEEKTIKDKKKSDSNVISIKKD